MIYLKLFLTFLEIGAVSFGGGYAMISLIREKCLLHAWLTEEEIMNFIAVAESTPGPIAVNMATFVGSSEAGILGSLAATLGIVLPSFIIILIIASLIKNFTKYKSVKFVLAGIRPVVIGLIVGTALVMLLKIFVGISTIESEAVFNYKALIIIAVITAIPILSKALFKKSPSPILLILVSAGIGMLMY